MITFSPTENTHLIKKRHSNSLKGQDKQGQYDAEHCCLAPPLKAREYPVLEGVKALAEADGMDVIVTRTVTLGDDVLHRDTIKTHYLPWRAIYEYGPGTELPDDAITDED